jgi:hypothetical protein
MILHAASMAALFVDQMAQAPVVVHCAQSAPEPTLEWLLPTVVLTVISVVSITAGVLIAVWSFRKHRQTEFDLWSRSQQTQQKQWLRDQEKAEWKELLVRVAEIENEIPETPNRTSKCEKLETVIAGILPYLRGTIFVYERLVSSGYLEEWKGYIEHVSGEFREVEQNRNSQSMIAGIRMEQTRAYKESQEKYDQEEVVVRNEHRRLLERLRTLAHEGLGMGDEQS